MDDLDYGTSYFFGALNNAGSLIGFIRDRLSVRGNKADFGESKPRTNSMNANKKDK